MLARAGISRVLALIAILSVSLPGQPTVSGDDIVIGFGSEGIELANAIEWASTSTGRPFQYKDADFRGKARIMMTNKVTIPKDRIFEFWQGIFVTQGFAMVPLGPGEGDFIMLEPIEQSRILKQRATFIPVEKLAEVRNKVGLVVMTTITLQHIEVGNVRNAVQQVLSNRQAEFAQEVVTANALIVVGFAPTVYAINEIMKAMDVPPAAATLKFEMIGLEHAVAEELQPIIADLITSTTQGGAGGNRAPIARPGGGGDARPGQTLPEPKIIADPRTNALVVYAIERDMNEIKRLISALDREVKDLDSNIRVYFLKNTNATDLERTLRDLLGQTTSRTGGGVGGRPGAQATSTNARGRDIVIVADGNTNSLLIQASKTAYEEIEPLIDQLDKRRPQVLVHAAIAELSDTDLRNISVELTGIEGGQDRYRFAGATGFGLSTITFGGATGTTGGGTTGGNGTGTGGAGGGGTTGGTGTTGLLDDLVRIPFATDTGIGFSGLVAGIFERNLNVPLLVSMLQTYTKVNLLSNASVLTNDNEQSQIRVGQTINILRSETTAAGTDRVTADDEVEANLTLTISPHISNDNYLRLDIEFIVEAFQGTGTNGVPPPRTTREFNGSVTVPNGKTVVIGGLVQDNVAETTSQVPFFGDIPIIGELFKSKSNDVQKTTLYLFVTPTIINDFQQLEDISYERKLEIVKLDGNINLVDPNFRAVGIRDQEVDIDAIEDAGLLDMPRYSPVTPIGQAVSPRDVAGDPLRPAKSNVESAEIQQGGTLKFRGGQATRDEKKPTGGQK